MAPSAESQSSSCNDVKIYELDEVKKHDTDDDCWVVFGKNVYDVTPFLSKHPGGADFILREGGNDITNVLADENIHAHTTSAYNILREYKIGELNVQEGPEVELDINSNELVGYREDMVDWDKGMVLQVHKFGKEYNKWVHSPVNRSIKMFDNKFVEFFSNTPWYAIPIIWLPVVVICIVLSYQTFISQPWDTPAVSKNVSSLLMLLAMGWYFCVGAFTWTLVEYVLHRYVFHLEPNGDSSFQITMHFFFHGLHHKVPFDGGRLVFPPTVAAIFGMFYWYALNVFCSGGVQLAVYGGGIFGYICYDMIHYYIHHGNPKPGSYLHRLKRYHNAHHFEDPNNGFGISSKFWDIIFDTSLRIKKML